VSAGEWLWHAALSAHYAQFMWFHDPERREAGQHAKVALYRDAAPFMAPAAERLDLPFEDTAIPAYLRRPDVDGPVPCVVLIGGLESTKEESYLFEAMCLRRGMATLAFDGPGQGEMFFTRKLGPGFEKVTSTVVDHLENTASIDAGRIGVLGRSLGAYYSVLSASCDPRLRACVAWGACFDLSDLDTMPPHTRDGFIYVTGTGPIGPDGKVVGETIEEQTHKTIDNIEAVLRAEGASLSDVIKVNVHLIDTNLFPRYNQAYQERFSPPYPARTTVGSDLPQVPGMMIEIEAIAYVGD